MKVVLCYFIVAVLRLETLQMSIKYILHIPTMPKMYSQHSNEFPEFQNTFPMHIHGENSCFTITKKNGLKGANQWWD